MSEKLRPTEGGERLKVSVDAECSQCDGTGLSKFLVSDPNLAMVCHVCKGEGKKIIEYTPFAGRKIRADITRVTEVVGSIAPGLNPAGEGISYEEFLEGKRPTA